MFDFTRELSIGGKLNYIMWRLRGRRDPANLGLKSGKRIYLRRQNYGVAYEIFVRKYYQRKFPAAKTPRLIVDLGANVGFSCIYFMQEYPDAKFIAFEPHPRHVEQMRANLALNAAADRVTLYEEAASNRQGQLSLSDLGTSSSTTKMSSKAKRIEVKARDIFPLLEGRRIDILKIDIEGGEYDILADDRFAGLDIQAIVMEWHRVSDQRDDHVWCIERLKDFGFEIAEIFNRGSNGMLWAFKPEAVIRPMPSKPMPMPNFAER